MRILSERSDFRYLLLLKPHLSQGLICLIVAVTKRILFKRLRFIHYVFQPVWFSKQALSEDKSKAAKSYTAKCFETWNEAYLRIDQTKVLAVVIASDQHSSKQTSLSNSKTQRSCTCITFKLVTAPEKHSAPSVGPCHCVTVNRCCYQGNTQFPNRDKPVCR